MAACRVLTDDELEAIDLRPSLRVPPPPALGRGRGPGGGGQFRTAMTTSGDDPEYFWDLLNRMVAYFPDGDPGDETRYAYRADGMRTVKVESTSTYETETKYYYDGQMGVMDVEVYDPASGPNVVTVRKYGVGARGIDVITKKVDSGSEQFGYPVYDTHGNMVATLARSGSHSYSVGNVQFYDVWGGVRSGSSTEDQGYVANLGHRKDDESGLTYMRARYYEPGTGRFVTEDPSKQGANWYIYCDNIPNNNVDPDGKSWVRTAGYLGGAISWFIFFLVSFTPKGQIVSDALRVLVGVVTAHLVGKGSTWADNFARNVRQYYLSQYDSNGPTARFAKLQAHVAFYVGYSLFLICAQTLLDAWIQDQVNF